MQSACSDDVVPGTGSASITILNPADANGETRTYAWTLTGPSGTKTGGVVVDDGASSTIVANALSAGDYSFEAYDAALPALAASTTVSVAACPPPPTTTTTTTTTTTPSTTTTTTMPQGDPTTTTERPETTIVVDTTPPTPPPANDPAPPTVLPVTGSGSVAIALVAGVAVFAGSLPLLLLRRRRTTR